MLVELWHLLPRRVENDKVEGVIFISLPDQYSPLHNQRNLFTRWGMCWKAPSRRSLKSGVLTLMSEMGMDLSMGGPNGATLC